jgi:hypothetical protein
MADLAVEKSSTGRESLLGSGSREYSSCAISAESMREVLWNLFPRIIDGLSKGDGAGERRERTRLTC